MSTGISVKHTKNLIVTPTNGQKLGKKRSVVFDEHHKVWEGTTPEKYVPQPPTVEALNEQNEARERKFPLLKMIIWHKKIAVDVLIVFA